MWGQPEFTKSTLYYLFNKFQVMLTTSAQNRCIEMGIKERWLAQLRFTQPGGGSILIDYCFLYRVAHSLEVGTTRMWRTNQYRSRLPSSGVRVGTAGIYRKHCIICLIKIIKWYYLLLLRIDALRWALRGIGSWNDTTSVLQQPGGGSVLIYYWFLSRVAYIGVRTTRMWRISQYRSSSRHSML